MQAVFKHVVIFADHSCAADCIRHADFYHPGDVITLLATALLHLQLASIGQLKQAQTLTHRKSLLKAD